MAGPKGYNSYRGKTSIGKIILAIVLVLVIAAAVTFLLLQRYIVYDDSGKPRLELPQHTQETPSPSPQGSQSPGDDDLPPITIQQPESTPMKGILLTQQPLTDWDASLLGREDNAVAVTMKASGGVVYLASDSAVPDAVETAEGSTAALAAMMGDDEYTIARFSCFRDSWAAKSDVENMGLKNTGGYIFYDGNNEQWLDPAKPAARQYLCTLSKECADLGFDELLLTDLSYPTQGKLNKIAYGEGDKSTNIRLFLTELRAALSGTDMKLSVELPTQVLLTGSDQDAGLVLSDLAPLVDRIYVRTTEDQIPDLQAALPDSVELVPELSAPSGDTYLITAD